MMNANGATKNAIISITNLRLRTFIGFNEEERTKQQDVIINVDIHYPANDHCLADEVESALNYKTITKHIIQHTESGHFLLLEKLVMDILEICTSHPWVQYARVKVDKPHALRFADSVSLTLEHHANTAAPFQTTTTSSALSQPISTKTKVSEHA